MNHTLQTTAPGPFALTVTKNEARADSRQLAEHLGLQHKSVFQTINDYRDTFEVLGKVRFQNAASTGSATGQRVRFALLNEDQAYLLLTMSRNTPRVVSLKLALVKAFRDTRLALAAYREGTLPSTKGLQDAIQAVPGGPGPWLYSNISKLVNTTAGIEAGTRTEGNAPAQALLTLLQHLAMQSIQRATDAKDAYYRAKDALQPLMAITAHSTPEVARG